MINIVTPHNRIQSAIGGLPLAACLLALATLTSTPLCAAVDSSSIAELRQRVAALHSRAEHQGAVEAVAAQLAALAKLDNTESGDTAELLLMLGDAQMKAGLPKLAFASNERAWKLRERLFGANDARTLDALTPYLEACALVGSVKNCDIQAGAAVVKYETLGDKNAPGLAAMLRTHALLAGYAGRNAQAIPLLDRAMTIWQTHGTQYEQNILDARSSKAVLLLNLGQLRQALAAVEEMLPRQRELLGERAPQVLSSLHLRATVLSRMGYLDRALDAATETLRLRTAALSAEHQDTITARQLLGTIQLKIGRVSEAAATLASTVQLLERVQGADNADTIDARRLHGVTLRYGGRYQESVDVLRRVVDDHKRVFGETHPDHGTNLAALATSLQAAGDVAAAISAIDRAVELGIATRGPTHPTILVRRMTAMSMHEWAGLAPNAEDLQPIVDGLTERLGAEHPDTLAARHLHAVLLSRGGAVSRALELMRTIAAVRKRILGESHIDAMKSQAALGQLLMNAQRPEEALATFNDLLPQVRSLRRSVAFFGPVAQQQIVAQFHPYLVQRIVLLARSGRLEDAFVAVEEYKAQTLLEQMARQSAFVGTGLPSQLADRLRRLSSRHASFDSAAGTESRAEPRDALLQSLRATHGELEAALREASALSPRLASLLEVGAPRASDIDVLHKTNTALVHYLRGDDDHVYAIVSAPTPKGSWKLHWFELGKQRELSGNVEALRIWASAYGDRFATDASGRRLAIYRSHAGAQTRWHATADTDSCESGVARFNCIPVAAGKVDSDSEFAALRGHLGDQLLRPLLPVLAGATSLLIAPDGPLALLPWDLLLVDGKSGHEQWQISVTPSLAVLNATRQRGPARPPRALLALAASNGRVVKGEHWPALPYAAIEANAAVALFRGQGTMALLGNQATKSNLRRLADTGGLRKFQRLLVAAHGRFDSKRPLSNAIILAEEAHGQTDDVLTVSDWVGMPLNSDLVVLSACDSAQGQLVSGEGLIGFSYALNVAGNRNLLATLWSVGDRAASDFVVEFLRNTKRGFGHVEALTRTKRAFSNHPDVRRRNPRVWGAFVLIGK